MTSHRAIQAADAFARPDDLPAAFSLIHEFALNLAAAGFDPSALADALLAEAIALTSIVDGSVKAEDALKKLIVQLALAAIQAKLLGTGPLAGLFGGFNPTAGGFASMLGIPGYANGTNFHPGGMAVVGERGPELLNLPRGSQVMPRVPKAFGGGGGGRSEEIRVIVQTNDPLFTAHVERISGGVAQKTTARGLQAYDAGKARQQLTAG